MNLYRVTFYADGGVTFKTVLEALDNTDIEQKVMDKINSEVGTFEVEGKHNRTFKVQKSGYSFIEYELMRMEAEHDFHKLTSLKDEDLQSIFDSIENDDVIAIALKNVDKKIADALVSPLSSEKRTKIEQAIVKATNSKTDISEENIARSMVLEKAYLFISKNEANPNSTS